MRMISGWRRHHYPARICIFLILVALIAGMAGCGGSGGGEGTESYTLTVNSTIGGVVAVNNITIPWSAMFSYDPGTVISLNATADIGYHFGNWTASAGTFGSITAATTTFTMPAQNVTVTANFVIEIPPDAVEVRTWYDLDAIRNDLGGYYILMNDLDSSAPGYGDLAGPTANNGTGWQPIGIWIETWNETILAWFNGTLDGQGFRIQDLYINYSGERGAGLFELVGEEGIIRNIGMVNASVTDNAAASLAFVNCGTMSKCYSDGNVTGEWFAGGLVGLNADDSIVGMDLGEGTVVYCYSSANVTVRQGDSWDECAGGLLGVNGGCVINSCSTGTVAGGGSAGGLVGVNGGSVSNSYSVSGVTGYKRIGGLAGVNINRGTVISNSYSTGGVTGDLLVGGLVGENYEGNVTNCYATGNVAGNSFVGGLVGGNAGNVTKCYSTGQVAGNSSVGGLVGVNNHEGSPPEGTTDSSFWDTQTSGQSTSAGGTGKTTAEMKNITTFSAWNIIAVANPGARNLAYLWNIVDDVTYPFLIWQPVS